MILIVVMGGEIIYLIYQNRRLQSMLADVPPLRVLQRGQAVPPLATTNLDGAGVAIRYGERAPSTVLIWFSPSCHICSKNTAFWNDLYDRYRTSSNIRFLIMSDEASGRPEPM